MIFNVPKRATWRFHMTTETLAVSALSAEEVLKHWQGHRRLTRKTIEAFPEDKLFNFFRGWHAPLR